MCFNAELWIRETAITQIFSELEEAHSRRTFICRRLGRLHEELYAQSW